MKTRISLAVLGIAMMLFGVVSALIGPHFNPVRQSEFLAAALLAHDALLMPLFLAIGALTARFVSPRHRSVVQAALIATMAITIVELPFMLGYGRRPDVPSALPRNYLGGYALTVGAIWLWATLVIVRHRLRPRNSRRQEPSKTS
jgi:hypothetical protein